MSATSGFFFFEFEGCVVVLDVGNLFTVATDNPAAEQ